MRAADLEQETFINSIPPTSEYRPGHPWLQVAGGLEGIGASRAGGQTGRKGWMEVLRKCGIQQEYVQCSTLVMIGYIVTKSNIVITTATVQEVKSTRVYRYKSTIVQEYNGTRVRVQE